MVWEKNINLMIMIYITFKKEERTFYIAFILSEGMEIIFVN